MHIVGVPLYNDSEGRVKMIENHLSLMPQILAPISKTGIYSEFHNEVV